MRERARRPVLTVAANTEVLGIDVERGRVQARAHVARRDRGRARRDRVRRLEPADRADGRARRSR